MENIYNALGRKKQKELLRKAINSCGKRYQPDLNINVDSVKQSLDIVARRESFLSSVKASFERILKYKTDNRLGNETHERLVELCKTIDGFIKKYPDGEIQQAIFDDKTKHLVEALDKESRTKGGKDRWLYDELIRYSYEIENAFNHKNIKLYSRRLVLLKGEGGIGKTHLLCDYASSLVNAGENCFFFVADNFDNPEKQRLRKNPVLIIARRLGYRSRKVFIRELGKFIEKNGRVCIIIDALNECPYVYWRQIEELVKIKGISVILSIRSGFEKATKIEGWNLPQLIHPGFADASLEWTAVQKFFRANNIKDLPETPVLYNEFRNPLFLKIYCESYGNSKDDKKPRGHMMTNIFEQYVANKTKNISRELGLNITKKEIWNVIIKEVAEELGKCGLKTTISSRNLLRIIGANKKFCNKKVQMADVLCKHGILRKIPHYTKRYKTNGYDYEFAYHKFSDYLIVRYFFKTIPKELSSADVMTFIKASKLFRKSLKEYNSGIIEALSTQLPESCPGQEICSIIPNKYVGDESINRAVLNSLIWREVKAENGRCLTVNEHEIIKFLKKNIRTDSDYYEYIDCLLTISIVAGHPFNAKKFHQIMLKCKMPERDSWWQQYLFYMEEGNSFDRICGWTFSKFGEEASLTQRYLAILVLCWFLASTNGYMRTRASYAIIKLLKGNLNLALKILEDFEKCDDPYVTERLYCIVYGAVLKEDGQQEAFRRIVKHIDKCIFSNMRRIPDIMIDQFAKDIVLTYRDKYEDLSEGIVGRCLPPYGYYKDEKKLLKREEIIKKYGYNPATKERRCQSIVGSVLYPEGGIADFGKYVVSYYFDKLTDVKISEEINADVLACGEFYSQLTAEQLRMLYGYRDAKFNSIKRVIPPIIANIVDKNKRTTATLELSRERIFLPKTTIDEVKKAKKDFEKALSGVQRKNLKKISKYIIEGEKLPVDYVSHKYDPEKAQNWIFQNVIDLGWNEQMHGEFDDTVARVQPYGNEKPFRVERIGKKYEWISLYQLLGLELSGYYLRPEREGFSLRIYNNTTDLNLRDFDPSIPLEELFDDNGYFYESGQKRIEQQLAREWWNQEFEIRDDEGWFDGSGEPFRVDKYITIKNEPIVLMNHMTRTKEDCATKKRLSVDVNSYLVKMSDMKSFISWYKNGGSRQFDSWIVYEDTLNNFFLEEILQNFQKYEESFCNWLQESEIGDCPFRVFPTSCKYYNEPFGVGSIIKTGIDLPTPAFSKIISLKRDGDINFRTKSSGSRVYCPALKAGTGSYILLCDATALNDLLSRGYGLFWTIREERLKYGLNKYDISDRWEIKRYAYCDENGKIVGRQFNIDRIASE